MSHGISEMERLFSNMCVQVSFFFFFFSNRSELSVSYVKTRVASFGASE